MPDTQRTVRILLVEDRLSDGRLVEEILRQLSSLRVEVKAVERLADAPERLRSGQTDVVLLDLSLPNSHGLATVRRLLEHAPEVPVIVLTAWHDQELAEEALRMGAEDCLVRSELDGRAIRYAHERKERENEQRRSEAAIALLHQLTLAITQAENVEEALAHLLQEVCRATGWATGETGLPDGTGARLQREPVCAGKGEPLGRFHAASEEFRSPVAKVCRDRSGSLATRSGCRTPAYTRSSAAGSWRRRLASGRQSWCRC
jgi:DNA-binding NtrC family response regulator